MSNDSEIPVLIRLRAVLAAVNDDTIDERSKAIVDLVATIAEGDVHPGLSRHQAIAKELLYAALSQLDPSIKVKIASRLSSEKRFHRIDHGLRPRRSHNLKNNRIIRKAQFAIETTKPAACFGRGRASLVVGAAGFEPTTPSPPSPHYLCFSILLSDIYGRFWQKCRRIVRGTGKNWQSQDIYQCPPGSFDWQLQKASNF